jgi:hypothetical protein
MGEIRVSDPVNVELVNLLARVQTAQAELNRAIALIKLAMDIDGDMVAAVVADAEQKPRFVFQSQSAPNGAP